MTPKSVTHSPVPHHCLGPSRAPALGHGAESVPTSTGAYRRMFPELPRLPGDEAFLHKLGTSCGVEVSANGKDDASGAAGWTFLGQFIAHDVIGRSPRSRPESVPRVAAGLVSGIAVPSGGEVYDG